jgi:hypothetical protein
VEETWFETNEDDELDDVQAAFVSRLREHAAGWSLRPVDGCLVFPPYDCWPSDDPRPPDERDHGNALVYLDIRDYGKTVVLTVGVYLYGDRVRGDQVHNQSFCLPAEPTRLAFQATGPPDYLADQAAAWVESVLRLPIERHEWLWGNEVYARQWVVAGVPRVAAGRTQDVGGRPPDRIVHVRVDRA